MFYLSLMHPGVFRRILNFQDFELPGVAVTGQRIICEKTMWINRLQVRSKGCKWILWPWVFLYLWKCCNRGTIKSPCLTLLLFINTIYGNILCETNQAWVVQSWTRLQPVQVNPLDYSQQAPSNGGVRYYTSNMALSIDEKTCLIISI